MTRYFSNLDFYWDRTELGSGLQTRRNQLTVIAYLLLSAGIFTGQAVDTKGVDFRPVHLSTLGASFVIGLALLPPVIRWLNRRRTKPSLEHFLTAFSIGFFINLSSTKVLQQIWHALI
jgi:hypothetical protein